MRLLEFWRALFDFRFFLGGGGGGGGGTTKFEWNDALAPYWKSALSEASGLKNQPYQQYPNQRIADLMNSDTQASYDAIRYFTDHGGPQGNQARQMLTDTFAGNYYDPWAAAMVTPSSNQYMGESPYYRSVVQQGLNDIASTYKNATSPDLNAAAVQAGVLGGGDWERQKAKNEDVLGRNLSNYTMQMGNTNYDRSAQLQEAALGREQQADIFNKGTGSASWNAERERQMAGVPQGMQTERDALAGWNVRMGLGDITRQYQQSLLNQNYTDWQTQMNYPKDQLGWFTQYLTGAQGGLGPNQTTSYQGVQSNPYSNILGSALAAYGMFRT